jgi:type I restriction-modification system DNA methylase subunit
MVIKSRQPPSQSLELFAAEEFLGDDLLKMKSTPSDERGAIFTRPEVVDFMLDLIGYTPDRPLWQFRLLEPSFGGGEFLLRAVERLLEASHKAKIPDRELASAIQAVELHRDTFEQTRNELAKLLTTKKCLRARLHCFCTLG